MVSTFVVSIQNYLSITHASIYFKLFFSFLSQKEISLGLIDKKTFEPV